MTYSIWSFFMQIILHGDLWGLPKSFILFHVQKGKMIILLLDTLCFIVSPLSYGKKRKHFDQYVGTDMVCNSTNWQSILWFKCIDSFKLYVFLSKILLRCYLFVCSHFEMTQQKRLPNVDSGLFVSRWFRQTSARVPR